MDTNFMEFCEYFLFFGCFAGYEVKGGERIHD